MSLSTIQQLIYSFANDLGVNIHENSWESFDSGDEVTTLAFGEEGSGPIEDSFGIITNPALDQEGPISKLEFVEEWNHIPFGEETIHAAKDVISTILFNNPYESLEGQHQEAIDILFTPGGIEGFETPIVTAHNVLNRDNPEGIFESLDIFGTIGDIDGRLQFIGNGYIDEGDGFYVKNEVLSSHPHIPSPIPEDHGEHALTKSEFISQWNDIEQQPEYWGAAQHYKIFQAKDLVSKALFEGRAFLDDLDANGYERKVINKLFEEGGDLVDENGLLRDNAEEIFNILDVGGQNWESFGNDFESAPDGVLSSKDGDLLFPDLLGAATFKDDPAYGDYVSSNLFGVDYEDLTLAGQEDVQSLAYLLYGDGEESLGELHFNNTDAEYNLDDLLNILNDPTKEIPFEKYNAIISYVGQIINNDNLPPEKTRELTEHFLNGIDEDIVIDNSSEEGRARRLTEEEKEHAELTGQLPDNVYSLKGAAYFILNKVEAADAGYDFEDPLKNTIFGFDPDATTSERNQYLNDTFFEHPQHISDSGKHVLADIYHSLGINTTTSFNHLDHNDDYYITNADLFGHILDKDVGKKEKKKYFKDVVSVSLYNTDYHSLTEHQKEEIDHLFSKRRGQIRQILKDRSKSKEEKAYALQDFLYHYQPKYYEESQSSTRNRY